MSWRKRTPLVTWIIIGSFILAIAIYDIIAISGEGTEASISAYLIEASHQHPVIPWVLGLIMGFLSGHLFWRMRSTKKLKQLQDFYETYNDRG